MIPPTSALKMESIGIIFGKMSLMTLMTSLKADEPNGVKNWVMKRRVEEDEDDVEISMKNELIRLILRKWA